MIKILKKSILAPEIVEMELDAPHVAIKAKAGHFLMIRIDEKGERIPLTIADSNAQKGTVTIVFQTVGKTTKALAELKEGDHILDLLAPLGNPTETGKLGHVVVIGGGVGVAPVYPLARELKEEGNDVTAIVGYRSKDFLFWENKMKDASNNLVVMTNDGSYGEKGFVTDALKKILESGKKIERIYAIGPAIMMKAVADMTRDTGIQTIVSLNSLMVCGLGMCGACRCSMEKKTQFTCKDGPDFDAKDVNFDEFMKRLSAYKSENHA